MLGSLVSAGGAFGVTEPVLEPGTCCIEHDVRQNRTATKVVSFRLRKKVGFLDKSSRK